MLDDELIWKPPIKLGDAALQTMWNVIQIEALCQHFSAQICLLCSFLFLINFF